MVRSPVHPLNERVLKSLRLPSLRAPLMKRGPGLLDTPALSGLYQTRFDYPLPSSRSLLHGLRARSRSRGLNGDVAAREVYVVSRGRVLGDTLLVGNVAGVGDLLSRWTHIDVVARVLYLDLRRSGTASYAAL